MLRITVQDSGEITRFRLEGKLKGDWVRELERCWIHIRDVRPEMPLIVELSDVSFVDESGRSLLSRMVSQGARRKHKTIC